MSWADEEFLGVDLGDKRRDARVIRLVDRLAERPTASIPGACNGWAETQAAYRLLSGDEYDWMDILEPHRQCTRARMAVHPVVLCLQDTTELNFNGQATNRGRTTDMSPAAERKAVGARTARR